ncbi:endonuclease dU [Halobaculum gomorrense]|uniref:Uncharacterized protein n=1 Tax=Halobaculum gomorrense TaxID=43928 RepID=A0A1M5JU00_9EURY|nr:DUF99 family protein [Halobaculum gomorrense]SHG43885.1 hypothetical protein SAMN05443636_0262 [Halobaculum gomorrense]
MNSGTRALGVAVSARGRSDDDPPARATVAAAVVRADRVVDGLSFSTCTVGGSDATAAVADCLDRLDRPDARQLLLAGVAPAWFNLIDLRRVHEAADRPVVAVSFEASAGLEPHLYEHFSGEALDRRLAVYESLPDRDPLFLDGEPGDGRECDPDPDLWVRRIDIDAAAARRILAAHTPDGQGRPEPLRVARLAARAGRSYAEHRTGSSSGAGSDSGADAARDG